MENLKNLMYNTHDVRILRDLSGTNSGENRMFHDLLTDVGNAPD